MSPKIDLRNRLLIINRLYNLVENDGFRYYNYEENPISRNTVLVDLLMHQAKRNGYNCDEKVKMLKMVSVTDGLNNNIEQAIWTGNVTADDFNEEYIDFLNLALDKSQNSLTHLWDLVADYYQWCWI